MKELMKVKGTNGTIIAYDDRVEIKRKGPMSALQHGIQGSRMFFYKDISSVEYKKPGLIFGYMKFIVPGTLSKSSKFDLSKLIKSINNEDNFKDDNTVVLNVYRGVPKLSNELYDLIMKKIGEAHITNTNTPNLSCADELAKFKHLLDNGAITELEYANQKKKLLGL